MKQAPLLLAALVVGLGVGYLLGQGGEAGAGGHADRQAPQPEEAMVAPTIPRSDDDSNLGRALAELPVPKFPRGTGTITGTVTKSDGSPLAGVLVRAAPRATARSHRRGTGPPEDETLDDYVRRLVRRYHEQHGTRCDAVTGPDGRYTLTGITSAEYYVRAFLENWKLRSQQNWKVKAGATVDFTATRLYPVRVDVLLPDGRSPEQASLSWRQRNSSNGTYWIPGDPVQHLEEGTFTLTASIPGDDAYTCEPVTVTVGGEQAPGTVTVHLRSEPGIRGRVTLPAGMKAAGIGVVHLALDGEEAPDTERLVEKGKSTWYSGSQRYTIKSLAPGRHHVGIAVGGTLLDHRVVEVTDHMVDCDFLIESIAEDEFVRVRVLGPEGKPLPNVQFTGTWRHARGTTSTGASAMQLADGTWLVDRRGRRTRRGAFLLRARAEGFGESAQQAADGAREIVFRFGPPATLTVRVASAGKPLRFHLVRRGETAPWHEDGKQAAKGALEFGPVSAGEYDLVVEVEANRYTKIRAAVHPVSLRPGKNSIDVASPPVYTLTVEIPEGRGQVNLDPPKREGRFHYWVEIEKGRAVFANLPAGRYAVRYRGKQMTVDLQGDVRLPFEAELLSAFRVNGDAFAGLADGDLVVAIDGTEIKDRRHGYALLTVAREKESTVFTILRGRRRVDVTLKLKGMAGEVISAGLRPAAR